MGPHSPNPNGLVSEERRSALSNSTSTTTIARSLLSSSPGNPDPLSIGQECWVAGDRVTREEVLRVLRPTVVAEQRRRLVAGYVRKLVRDCVGGEVFAFGSVPLRTYLPDGDIDLTSVSGKKADDTLAMEVHACLEKEAQNNDMEFDLKDVQYIDAEVNQFIGKDHIFKCSIILIKAWCYYESRILGAYHGLISTYALEIMVLHIFNLFHSSLNGPLSVLYKFLDYYSKFDWEKYGVSIKGPVNVSFLPKIIAETPENDGYPLLLPNEFMQNCISLCITPLRSQEINQKPFTRKYLNIVDPLRDNNNLGRSVNKGNFYRIRAALSYGARQLGRILSTKEENIGDELKKFFFSTLERHKNDFRADLKGNLPTNCDDAKFVPSFAKPDQSGEYRRNVAYLQSSSGVSIGIGPQSHSAYFQSSTGVSIGNEPQRQSAHFLSSSGSIGNEQQIHYAHLQCSPSTSMESELQIHSAYLQSVLGIGVEDEPQTHSTDHLQTSNGIGVGNEPQRHSAHHQSSTGARIGIGIGIVNEPQRHSAHHQSSPGMGIGNEPQTHIVNFQPQPAMENGNGHQLDDRLIFGTIGGPDHALHFYHSKGFTEAVKFENMTQDQIVLANADTPEGDEFSSQFPQLPNGMYSYVLEQEAKNLAFVHHNNGDEIAPSNPLRHLPIVDSTCGVLSFQPLPNPMDDLAFSLGQMSVKNMMPENHQTMNPQLDLSGDPHAHFQHMHFALWCRAHSSSAPDQQALPLLFSQPPLLLLPQHRSSSETLQQPKPVNANMTPFPNNIHQAPPFYPRNHPEHPPIAIGEEEMPKARGLGTYFPNLDHQFQKEREYGRVRNRTPPMDDRSHRRTPTRERIPQDRNLHRNTKQENLISDIPVSHDREEAKNEEQPTDDDGSPPTPTAEEISLDNDNLPPPLDNDNLIPPPENHDSLTKEKISFDVDNFPPLGSTSLHSDNDPALEKVAWPSWEATSPHNDGETSLEKLKIGSMNDEKAEKPGDPLDKQKRNQTSNENSVSVPEQAYHLKDEKDFPPLARRGRKGMKKYREVLA
ncbi:hypothetical protein Syun_000096 [Stephania yunnanensis]|uniref:PAP/OAS1 substrate-binding-related domain-containing protein n=1 Tax=Stephania yunnanensis TaxID=152371 RepID=A0AAP0LBK1_9MAGN